jgi:flavin-dependent dehydrogenase
VERCDVLVVGGGPAGSTLARRLVEGGLDVVVLDRARFPRDKVCTGWITLPVVEAVGLDLEAYERAHTLQPFTGFRIGTFEREGQLADYDRPISYGIRRAEFDDWLLRRTGARLRLGEPLTDLQRRGTGWLVNESIAADLIVGAGGHFCPVARRLCDGRSREDVVVAEHLEFRMTPAGTRDCPVRGEWPELFFWPDLLGYGWYVRKGDFLNIGAGRVTRHAFPAALGQFTSMLGRRGWLPERSGARWRGHAYLLNRASARPLVDERAMLVGDAAGLAFWPSGEGILTAVESGLMAADTILGAAPDYSRASLAGYEARIIERFGRRGQTNGIAWMPDALRSLAARVVLGSAWLTRRMILEDGFLHLRGANLPPGMGLSRTG